MIKTLQAIVCLFLFAANPIAASDITAEVSKKFSEIAGIASINQRELSGLIATLKDPYHGLIQSIGTGKLSPDEGLVFIKMASVVNSRNAESALIIVKSEQDIQSQLMEILHLASENPFEQPFFPKERLDALGFASQCREFVASTSMDLSFYTLEKNTAVIDFLTTTLDQCVKIGGIIESGGALATKETQGQ